MYKKIIHLILLLDISFFYLIPMSWGLGLIANNYQKLGIVVICIIILLCKFKNIFRNKRYLFIGNILFFLMLLSFEIVLSIYRYNQDIISIVSILSQYLVILLYFLVAFYCRKEDNLIIIQKNIINFTIILSLILIVQYIIFNINGNLFLYIDHIRAMKSERFGTIRIYESTYFPILGMILSFGLLIKNKDIQIKKKCYLCVIVSLIHLLLVSKNRAALILVIGSIIYMLLIKYNKNFYKKFFVFLTIVLSIYLLFKIPVINRFISTISLADSSMRVRYRAALYYFNQFKEHPLFGMGLIKPIENDNSFFLVRGPRGYFYKEDMGVIGFLNVFGVIGIIWKLNFDFKLKRILDTINKKDKMKYLELSGLYFFIIIGSIVINPFDPQRAILLPLFMGMLDSAYFKLRRNRLTNKKV